MNYDIDYYKDEVHCLYAERKELQDRIDKAIKMIYKMTENELNYIHWKGKEVLVCGSDFEGAEILLDILKGSDSNEG